MVTALVVVLLALAVLGLLALFAPLGGAKREEAPPDKGPRGPRRGALRGDSRGVGFGPLGGVRSFLGRVAGELRCLAACQVGSTWPAVGEFTELTTVEGGTTSFGEKVVRFQDVPSELHGRPVHMLGVRLRVTVTADTVAATMPAAMSGWLIETLLNNIRLQVGTHAYIDGSSGFDAVDARAFSDVRLGFATSPTSDLPDADATGAARTIDLFLPFARPRATGSKRWDGALAVALFKNLASGNALRFNISQVPSRGAFAGVTFTAVTGITCQVVCAALDDLRSTAWQWRVRQTNELWWEEEIRGPIETLLMASQTGGVPTNHIGAVSNIKLQVDGQTVYDDMSPADIADAAFLRDPAVGLIYNSQNTVNRIPLLSSHLDHARTKLPRGRVRLEFNDGTFTQRRILFGSWGLRTGQLAEELHRQLGAPADPADGSRTIAVAREAGDRRAAPAAAPGLDGKVYWPGMPWGLPRSKLERAAGGR